MKIVYHHRIASKDGQYVHIEEMIEALRRHGHDIVLTGPQLTDEVAFGGESGAIDRLKRRLPAAVYEIMELAYGVMTGFRLARACSRAGSRLVYERYNLFLVGGALHRWLRGGLLLVEVNAPLSLERRRFGNLTLTSLARLTDRLIWRRADHIFTVTDVLADHIRAAGVPDDRISVTPNGIHLERFDNAPSKADAKSALGLSQRQIVGFTGFMREWHKLERIVDWLAQSRHTDTVFLIIGDGPARPIIEARAKALGVAERVIIKGVVDRNSIPDHLTAFDVALQPAVVPYASPLKLFEYMALGLPIIAPNSANIREILTHDHDALLVEEDDIAAALDRLLDDPAYAHHLGSQARATLMRRGLTWDHNARRVEAVFQDAISKTVR